MDKFINNVWQRYRSRRGDVGLRNILVERYMPLVEYQAAGLGAKLPNHVPYDDLVSEGCVELMRAVKAYDMDRGIKFETYAAIRIRGEMLDWLRDNDWIPRPVRAKERAIRQAEQVFRAEAGRPPTDEELAVGVGMAAVELDKFKAKARGMKQISIESQTSGSGDLDDNNMKIEHCLRDKRAVPAGRKLEQKEEIEALIRGFSCREKMIIRLRFCENLTLREIARAAGIVETRVCQMLPQLLNRIKAKIRKTSRNKSRKSENSY